MELIVPLPRLIIQKNRHILDIRICPPNKIAHDMNQVLDTVKNSMRHTTDLRIHFEALDYEPLLNCVLDITGLTRLVFTGPEVQVTQESGRLDILREVLDTWSTIEELNVGSVCLEREEDSNCLDFISGLDAAYSLQTLYLSDTLTGNWCPHNTFENLVNVHTSNVVCQDVKGLGVVIQRAPMLQNLIVSLRDLVSDPVLAREQPTTSGICQEHITQVCYLVFDANEREILHPCLTTEEKEAIKLHAAKYVVDMNSNGTEWILRSDQWVLKKMGFVCKQCSQSVSLHSANASPRTL